MSVYRPARKTSPEKLERARVYAKQIRDSRNEEEKEKFRAYMKEWNENNRERRRIYARERARAHAVRDRLIRKGLPEELESLVLAHNGLCDICSGKQKGRWTSLDIDHNHSTGAFRGMLCGHCNRALGLLNDDPNLLRKAADYLEQNT